MKSIEVSPRAQQIINEKFPSLIRKVNVAVFEVCNADLGTKMVRKGSQ